MTHHQLTHLRARLRTRQTFFALSFVFAAICAVAGLYGRQTVIAGVSALFCLIDLAGLAWLEMRLFETNYENPKE